MRLSPFPSLTRLLVLAASLAAAASPARAAYIVTFSQVGPDVVASGSGTIDLDGLTLYDSGLTLPHVAPGFATEVTGAAGTADEYSEVSGPLSFGPGGVTDATTGTDDLVGIGANLGGPGLIIVPTGYVSGAPLSSAATYAGQTLATLGLTPGVYVYNFGSGPDADTFTVNIAGAAPVPEPASLTLLGAAVVGFAAVHRRRRTA